MKNPYIWFINNKKGLIIGFIFGLIAPFLAALGLTVSFFEIIRPLLIGPMDFINNLIPSVQISSNIYYVPTYKWILTFGFNSICYSLIGGVIQTIIRLRKTPK